MIKNHLSHYSHRCCSL